MNWFSFHFSGRGNQRQQREESLARVKAASMEKLEKATEVQSESAELVKESVQKQMDQSFALRRVIRGAVTRLRQREQNLNLRRDTA